jgi:hypothetical protein
VLATLLLTWLATRAVPVARLCNGRYIVEYRLAAKIAGWCFLAIGLFISYAAAQASADQRVLAACLGGTAFLIALYIFLEAHFVRIEFDDQFIYTFAPWRKRRVIPWTAVTGYSAASGWYVLKTRGYGSIHLSPQLSGLATMREKWESVLHREPSNQALEPTAGGRGERLKDEL